MKASLTHAVWVGVALLISAGGAQAAGIWDNGGGDNQWETATNWDNNALPLVTDGVSIGGPYTAVLNTTQTVKSVAGSNSGGTLTINPGGNLSTTTQFVSQGANVFTLNVLGGSITSQRFFNAPSINTSGMNITMSSGSINFSNRFLFNTDYIGANSANPIAANRTVVTLSGGTFGSAAFTLYGADSNGHSAMNIIGSATSFNVSGITLANSTFGPDYSAALSFTFAGTTIVQRSTLSALYDTGGLVLGDNLLTVDFSDYANTTGGNYSVTLIDFAGGRTLTTGTDFLTPTFIYGSSGVTNATLVYDPSVAAHKVYRIDFEYVPEPATLGLLAIGGLMMIHRGRR